MGDSCAIGVLQPPVVEPTAHHDQPSFTALQCYGDHLDGVIGEGAFLGRERPGEVTITLDEDLLGEACQRKLGVHLTS